MKKLLLVITLAAAMAVGAEDGEKKRITGAELKARVEAIRTEQQSNMFNLIRNLNREQIEKQKNRATQAMTFYCSSAITNLTADLANAEVNQSSVSDEKIEIFLERCGWMLK